MQQPFFHVWTLLWNDKPNKKLNKDYGYIKYHAGQTHPHSGREGDGGRTFHIHAVDAAARQLLEAGDPKKNEELSEAALHTGFQKMGLGLEDLKAVYVRFN